MTEKITGYRTLNAEELALINKIKEAGERLDDLCFEVRAFVENQMVQPSEEASERFRLAASEPLRWLAIGRTDLQTGLMALIRAVAKPTTF